MFLKIFAMLLMLDVATFCEKFLLDAEYLIQELGRIRQLALMVPMHPDTYGPTNSVVDAVWNLEERLRYLRGLEEAKKSGATLANPKRAKTRRRRKHDQDDLFDTEELSGLRSAELNRELREIQSTTNQPSRQKKSRAAAVNQDRLQAALSRAGKLSETTKRDRA